MTIDLPYFEPDIEFFYDEYQECGYIGTCAVPPYGQINLNELKQIKEFVEKQIRVIEARTAKPFFRQREDALIDWSYESAQEPAGTFFLFYEPISRADFEFFAESYYKTIPEENRPTQLVSGVPFYDLS